MIGDVFGQPGVGLVKKHLPNIIAEKNIDFVIVNGENAAEGKGITVDISNQLFEVGADVLTLGNHVLDQKEIAMELQTNSKLLRPYNYPAAMPGRGMGVFASRSGAKVAVISVVGKVHMGKHDSAFQTIREHVQMLKEKTPFIFVDMHAEATSEKRAMGWFLDGLVSGVFGTHTHVPTADAEILPQGTAYITDIGMTGPYHSVIGLRTDLAINRFLYNDKREFVVAEGDARLYGFCVEVDDKDGRAISIEHVKRN